MTGTCSIGLLIMFVVFIYMGKGIIGEGSALYYVADLVGLAETSSMRLMLFLTVRGCLHDCIGGCWDFSSLQVNVIRVLRTVFDHEPVQK